MLPGVRSKLCANVHKASALTNMGPLAQFPWSIDLTKLNVIKLLSFLFWPSYCMSFNCLSIDQVSCYFMQTLLAGCNIRDLWLHSQALSTAKLQLICALLRCPSDRLRCASL